mgnify:CR=1 FL=1|tara:strand:+ start:2067 stop:2876 length:810 start_codon:yes stop_codon:yes gene_type:complete
MRDILEGWLAEDVGKGDFTSQAVVQDILCEAQVTGGPGIVSGIELVKRLLNMVNVDYQTSFFDGSKIELGDILFSLKGKSHSILKVERLLLNILCHLSGVATLTAEIVSLAKSVNPNVEILATRKTIPGFRKFEKEAVVHGGGKTHRIRLDDAILIKDNHLKLTNDISKAIVSSKLKYPDLMIEVEADTPEQALEAANFNADRVMLDNFTPELVKTTVSEIKSISDIEIEISGGVNTENIMDYAPYADFISLSSLTMAAPPVDFSLHVI